MLTLHGIVESVAIISEELSLATRAELYRSTLYSAVNKEQFAKELATLQDRTKCHFHVYVTLTLVECGCSYFSDCT